MPESVSSLKGKNNEFSRRIKNSLDMGDMVCMSYLNDLSDEELMMRPHPECNHLNWQVGHLIASDHEMVAGCLPDSLPALPDGFVEKYAKEAAANNDPSAFCTKEELMAVHKAQRDAAKSVLDGLSVDDLDKPSPEAMQSYAPTVGAVFNLLGAHWLMHAGQWVVIRRQTGKPVVI